MILKDSRISIQNWVLLKERITETLGDLYGMHWPYKQHTTSRNVKKLPHTMI